MKILCVFGKHQYGDPARGIGTEYAAFVPTLKRLGHQVLHFESWDRSTYADFVELNRALLNTVEQARPDVLLAVQMNYEIWLETLRIIQLRGDVATVCWTTDDTWKYEQVSRFLGPFFHAMTTTDPSVVPLYHGDGIANVLPTQWAARADDLSPPLPASECRYPVTFVGAAHGTRRQRVAKLARLGVEVQCFGHGWPSGSLAAEDLAVIMRQSIISLNFSNSSGRRTNMKARMFEVPGAGGFLLTEPTEHLERYYAVGDEIDVFHSMEDLARKVRHYLGNPDLRDRIAVAGFERTRREHTYDHRMEDVLPFALASRDQWIRRSREVLAPSFDDAVRSHVPGRAMKAGADCFGRLCTMVWGVNRGRRAARRATFELSWRICRGKTFSASGLPGRLFYDV